MYYRFTVSYRACCYAVLCGAAVIFLSQNGDLHRHGVSQNVGIPVGTDHKSGVFEFFRLMSQTMANSFTETSDVSSTNFRSLQNSEVNEYAAMQAVGTALNAVIPVMKTKYAESHI